MDVPLCYYIKNSSVFVIILDELFVLCNITIYWSVLCFKWIFDPCEISYYRSLVICKYWFTEHADLPNVGTLHYTIFKKKITFVKFTTDLKAVRQTHWWQIQSSQNSNFVFKVRILSLAKNVISCPRNDRLTLFISEKTRVRIT